jgi:LPXTG-motif cell wall-anchored protein
MKLKIAAVVAVLALAAAGPSLAQQTLESTQMRPLYMPSPAVLGEVVGMTSHSVTVRTAKDEEMVFEFDSRTVMPLTMPPGLRVKVEFHLMDNGMQHAGRITRLEPGSLDWQALDKQLSLADQERARRLEAQEATEDVDNSRVTASNESQEPTVIDNDDRGVSAAETEELPKTASPQPLLLVLGAAATSLAVGLGLGLRRKHA